MICHKSCTGKAQVPCELPKTYKNVTLLKCLIYLKGTKLF